MSEARTTACPLCGEPAIVVGERPPRGRCVACDLDFDLLPEIAVGEGPMRELPVLLAASGPPPTRHIALLDSHPGALRLRVDQAGPSVPAVVALFVACFVLPALSGQWEMLSIPLAALCASLVVSWWVFGREEIEITSERLTLRRGALLRGKERSVGLGEVETLLPPKGLLGGPRLRLREGGTIEIGRGLGHRRESLAWLARRVSRELGRQAT
jgi:hypothetical protein